jgi:hypothetical protein
MSSARYKGIPAKGIYLPNSPFGGFNNYMVRRGDLISHVVRYEGGAEGRGFARVLDLVTHDHEGKEFRKETGRGKQTKADPKLRVLEFNGMFDHAYERWVNVDDVTQCRTPNPEYARFAAWAMFGPLPSTEAILAASSYGVVCSSGFNRAADPHGNLNEGWRERVDASWSSVGSEERTTLLAKAAEKEQPKGRKAS